MPIDWDKVGRTAGRLGRTYGPVVVDGVRRRLAARPGAGTTLPESGGPPPTGRPATTSDAPTASRARRLEYSPQLDGRADPGEIVWTWVEFEEHDGRGKDRPVLVVGRDGSTLLGLMLSSQGKRADDPNWVPLGAGAWDDAGRPSYVRLDRVLEVPEDGIRREGAICDRDDFDIVATRLRTENGWS